MPTASNATASNYKIYFSNFDGSTSTPVTLVKTIPGDADGVRSALTMQFDAVRSKFYVTVPQITELPQYLILGNSSADSGFPACPSSVVTTPVSCDAVSLKWTIPGIGYDKISIYYYQAGYGEVAPAFDLGNPKWKLYSDELPPTTTETIIAGLAQMVGNHYLAILPVKAGKIPTTTCVHLVKTAACFGGIAASTVTSVNVGNTEANDLFNYSDLTFCYPQRGGISGGWDDASTTLDINLVTNGSSNYYKLHAISVYDANGIGDIQIFGDPDFDNNNGNFVLLGNYTTSRYNEWATIPLKMPGNWKRLRLVRNSTQAIIQRMVLYGYLNTTGYVEPGCCGSTSAIQVGSGATPPKATASAAFGANTNQVGQEIVIKGSFNFDMNLLTLDNCNIYADPTADVSLGTAGVNATKVLNIKGSTIQGCKTLWKGITVHPYGQLYVEPNAAGKKPIIRDAERAFNIMRSGDTYVTYFKLDRAILEKNLYGLFINFNSAGVTPIDIHGASIVKGTIFDGTDTELKPPYSGMTGYYAKAHTAVTAYTIAPTLLIGDALGNANQIVNSQIGMYVDNVSTNVKNTSFSNISSTAVSYGGYGLVARNQSKIVQTGFGKTGAFPLSFNKVNVPLYMEQSSFKLKDNRITEVTTGILANNSSVATGDFNNIENNSITTDGNGISLGTNNVKIRVLGNDIYNYKDKNIYGISGYAFSNTGPKVYDIRGNSVLLRSDPNNTGSYGAGILLNNTYQSNIQSNTVTVNNYTLSLVPPGGQNNDNGYYPYIHGIYGANNKSGYFCSNVVTGVYNNQGWGIKTESSTSNKYDCNTTGTIRYGATFYGDCTSPGGLVDNDFGNHLHGLFLQANGSNTAKVGAQTHTGNDWLNFNGGTWGAVYQNATSTDVTTNRFEVNANDPILGHAYAGSDLVGFTGNIPDWFFQTSGTDLACANPCGGYQINLTAPGGAGETTANSGEVMDRDDELLFTEGLYYNVATGADNLSAYAPAYGYIIRRNVLRDLKDYYGVAIPAPFANFAQAQDNVANGHFLEVDLQIGQLGLTDPTLLENIRQTEQQIEELSAAAQPSLNAFQALSSAQQAAAIAAGSVVTPSPLLPGLWQKRKQYQAALTAQIAAKVEMLGAANAAAAPVETYEAYEQEMNAIYLSTLAIGNTQLSDYQRERVELVADLCPFEGGFATYKARGIYGTVYRHFRPEWFACAEEIKPREGLEKEKKAGPEATNFRLVPNPANDQFYVVCHQLVTDGALLRLWNTTGGLMKQQLLAEQTTLLSADGLPAGVYLVEVINQQGFRSVRKLQIIH